MSTAGLRRRAPLLLAALVAVAITIPATAFGIHQFTDVPDSNPFHADIDALADSGVTTGCGTGIYCPKDFVTREQMAAFMNRLGALGAGKTPVVNAKTAQTAANADKLDGFHANDLSRFGSMQTTALVSGSTASSANLNTGLAAPGPGYILIHGNAQVYLTSSEGFDTVTCKLLLDGFALAHSSRDVDVQYSTANAIYLDETVCATSMAVPVCEARNYQVQYRVESVAPSVDVQGATVSAQFLPFDQVGDTLSQACADGIGLPEVLPAATFPPKER